MQHRVLLKRLHLSTLILLAIGCVTALLRLQPAWGWRDILLSIAVGVVYGFADAHSVHFLIPGWVGPGIDDPAQPREIHINVTEAPFIFALLVIGPLGVVPLMLATALVTRWVRKRWWIEVAFNVTLLSLSYTMALAVLRLLVPAEANPFTTLGGAVALFLLVFFVPFWDAFTFTILIVVRSGRAFRHVLGEMFGPEVLIAIVPLAMGALSALAWRVNPPLILFAATPVIFAHRALHAVASWTEEHAKARMFARQLQEANRTLDARVQERTAELAQLHEQRVIETTEAMHDIRHRISALETAFDLFLLPLPASLRQLPAAAHALTRAKDALTALYAYLTTVLDAVQLQSGTVQLWPEEIDAGRLFEQAYQQLAVRFNALKCACVVEAPTAPLLVVADRARLERVAFNLLDNAAKFAADYASTQGITAAVTVSFSEEDGFVCSHIRDNGPGLTAEEVQQLGERGVRLGADPRRVEGNGLGLSFCFRAVSRMGGQLQVSSAGRGLGSTFTVWLPQLVPTYTDAKKPLEQGENGA
jgi:signal transduction histidine kinase